MPFFKRHAKCLLLLLVFGTGILITAPYARFQGPLSQGDHGRDLYAAQAVFRGELPYKDFWWVYGPLMPYYYGLFYKIFGIQISSIILGKAPPQNPRRHSHVSGHDGNELLDQPPFLRPAGLCFFPGLFLYL